VTVDELLAEVRRELRAHAEEEFRRGVIRYFREPVDPYGVRGPEVKAIARTAYRELKSRPAAQRNRFIGALWKSGKLEEGGIAIEIDRRFGKLLGAAEFDLLERRLDRYVHNWAHCDGLSTWLLAAAVGNEPELIARLGPWTSSRNRWKRRASIVALLQEAKRGRSTKEIFEIAGTLLDDTDDMVRKGVGWVLKETYPKKPAEVMAFLLPRAANAPRLVLRLAAEKMSGKDRAALLGDDGALTTRRRPLPHAGAE
jgi:3-methyladenine DNA glycosylase AlkD